MPMQEKAVGDNADLCCRPMPPNHDDEFRQTGMNGQFAAEKIEFVHQKPIAPCFHPAIRVRQVQIAAVPVIGIVTAAVTGQIAGVGHMQFQAIDSPARPGWFGPPKPQDTGHGRKKFHDFPEGWENFGCVVSASSITAKPGQKLIWVSKDRSIFEYIEGKLAVLEIGAKLVPGISSAGVYDLESYGDGTLRWTSQAAHFEVPNIPANPSRSLRLELWPMPLSSDTLKISVNGDTVYHGNIPSNAVTMSLDKFVAQDKLTIELLTTAVTHYPNDPRELGIAIKELRLGK
jgi:hypothetical protein